MQVDPAEFFSSSAKKIYEHLLSFNPSPRDLTAWLSNPDIIDRLVAGTSMEILIFKKAPAQRLGIMSSLRLLAKQARS